MTKIYISTRLPRELIERIDAWVKNKYPMIKNRTHAIEIALIELLKEKK